MLRVLEGRAFAWMILVTLLTIGPAALGSPVEITFWHPFSAGVPRDAIESLVERFNSSQAEVRVVTQIFPDIVEKVHVAILAGTPPDLATNLYPWIEGGAGMLTDLTPLAERDGLRLEDEFFPAGIPGSSYYGRLYGLPWFHVVHPILYYRVDAYEEAGYNPNAPPTTWEELYEYSRRMTVRNAEGIVTQLGFDWGRGSSRYTFPMYYRVASGEYVDYTGTEVVINSDLGRWVLNWLVDVRTAIQHDLAAATGTFYNRGHVHLIEGNWVASHIMNDHPHLEADRHWAMARFPVPEGQPQITGMSTRFLTIPRGAPNVEAAWIFLKWLSGPEANRQYSLDRGLVPANREAALDPGFAQEFPFWDVQKAMFDMSIPQDGSVPLPDSVQFLGLMQNAMDRALAGSASPNAALEDVSRQMQAFLDEHLK